MGLITKSFKGKTLKALVEEEKDAFWGSSIYCPWCSELKRVTGKASPKRAAKSAFDLIEAHWKIEHKN